MNKIQESLANRFMNYVQIHTTSDPLSTSYPSTKNQTELCKLLLEELKQIGIQDVEMDEFSYVVAKIPSNSVNPYHSIFFCAHVDTAPDYSGENVKPILRKNYKGETLTYPNLPDIVLSPEEHPNLKKKIGHDLITSSGDTLLGADDKAGVAIIMELADYLLKHPEVEHGDIYLLFTPDEEIGKGVLHFDTSKVPADFGFTLDGGEVGEIYFENFSADSFDIEIEGVSAHPGYAKGLMENAIKIASEIVAKLPQGSLSPETTEKKAGFIHPTSIKGDLASAKIGFILRDFDTPKLSEYGEMIRSISNEVISKYPSSSVSFSQKKQYRNMKDEVDKHPYIYDIAEKAIREEGIIPDNKSIRGGTDGAVLTYMGLPCPNLFAGQQAIHSRYEWISIQDMEIALKVILNICKHSKKG